MKKKSKYFLIFVFLLDIYVVDFLSFLEHYESAAVVVVGCYALHAMLPTAVLLMAKIDGRYN